MPQRRSLRLPITLGVTMIVLLVILIVAWILLAVFGAMSNVSYSWLYWALLPVGTVFSVLLLLGVVIYLILSIKAINLSRRQSNFIDSVTHELKLPISSMKLYLQTLKRRKVSEDELETFCDYMLDDLGRLDRMASAILIAGRLEAGRTWESPKKAVRLDVLLDNCINSVCKNRHCDRSRVTTDLQECTLWTNEEELAVLLRNLIDNGIKYADEDSPEVEVKLFRDQQKKNVVVTIADNGQGVRPGDRKRIFKRFLRLGDELERKKPGTGLGLYIVKTLVSRMRGTIRVLDRDDRQGALFRVTLPVTEENKK